MNESATEMTQHLYMTYDSGEKTYHSDGVCCGFTETFDSRRPVQLLSQSDASPVSHAIFGWVQTPSAESTQAQPQLNVISVCYQVSHGININ